MSYDDSARGQRIASDGGSPNRNNQDQADGWKALCEEQTRPQYCLPPELPGNMQASSAWSPSPSWEPAQSWGVPSQGWTPISLACLLLTLAAVAGGWFGYAYGKTQHWSGIQAWSAMGGGALVAALSATAILSTIAYAVKGVATVLWWLAAKMFWLILIVAGISAAGWAVTIAYYHGSGDVGQPRPVCHLCFSIRDRLVSATTNIRAMTSGPALPRSVGTAGLTCPNEDKRVATSVGNAMSAKNQISGRVSNIQPGIATSVVTIKTDGPQLMSALTHQAVQELGLKANDSVMAFVTSTEITLVKGDPDTVLRVKARNNLSGRVVDIQKGNATSCVTIDVGNWKLMSAIPRQAIDELQIKNGEPVTAIFKATDVLLRKS